MENYLEAHAAAQRGEVLPQVVPTGQDSVILISRVAHGTAYYWHAQDETYFREYKLGDQCEQLFSAWLWLIADGGIQLL